MNPYWYFLYLWMVWHQPHYQPPPPVQWSYTAPAIAHPTAIGEPWSYTPPRILDPTEMGLR